MEIPGVRDAAPSCATQQIELVLDSEQASLKVVQEALKQGGGQAGGWETREASATRIE